MSDETETYAPSVSVRVVYEDLPDLIDIETRVVVDDWSGRAFAYTAPTELRDAAQRLLEWSQRPSAELEIEAGADTGIGWLHLRCFVVDKANHVVCRVELATRALTPRGSESSWRIAVEMPTELGLIEKFARQLSSLAAEAKGVATLKGVIG